MSTRKPWSPEEENLLRTHYGSGAVIDLSRVAEGLGRSHASVAVKASRLGLGDFGRPKRSQLTLLKKNLQPSLSYWSPEERNAALSVRTRERLARDGHPKGMLGKKHSVEMRQALGARIRRDYSAGMRKKLTPEQTAASGVRLVAWAKANPTNVYSRAKRGRRDDLGGRYFRSAWEADYARYLNWLMGQGKVASWKYEVRTFEFTAIKRGTRSYLPDFQVVMPNGSVEWHEVKGWMDDKSRVRLARMAKYFPDEVVVVRGREFFQALRRQGVVAMVPGWESKA